MKKICFKKTLLPLLLVLTLLPVLPGPLPPADPLPAEPDPEAMIEGDEEPGIQPLNDNSVGNKLKN